MFTFILNEPRTAPLLGVQSTLLHVALVTSALWATRSVAGVIADPPYQEIDLTWHEATEPFLGPTGLGVQVAPPIVTDIPTTLPPIDPILIGPAPIDPRKLVGAFPVLTGTDSSVGAPSSASSVYAESEVDDPPVLLIGAAPRYPRVMAEAGIDGRVTLNFVIDTLGRVVPGSVKAESATHPAFIPAAEEATYASRFRPAHRHGEAVAVRVRQGVAFRH